MRKFFEPLSTGTPPREVASTLPALLNSIKMIFTISRYFGTPDKIAQLFAKITHQMIRNCQKYAAKKMEEIMSKQILDVKVADGEGKYNIKSERERASRNGSTVVIVIVIFY